MNKFLAACLGFLAVLILSAALLGFWIVSIRNGLVAKEEDVDAKWAQIDNQLKLRSEKIPNLVNIVKGYSKHESEVFQMITDARAKIAGAQSSVSQRAKAEEELSGAMSRLLVISESNPELKADRNFTALMDEWAGVSNRIGVARRDYNEAVRKFNTAIKQFPNSAFGFSPKEYFQIEEKDKSVPDISF